MALRVVANICPDGENAERDPALPALRAILTSAGRGLASPSDVRAFDWNWAFARSAAAVSDVSAVYSAAVSAAYSAALSAYSGRSAARSAAHSARSAAHSAAHSAANWDAFQPINELGSIGVWNGADVPPAIAHNHMTFLGFLQSDPAWSFWLLFYEGMWNGTFTDWDLAFEVIKIAEEDWEQGYQRIGEVIEGLARDLAAKAAKDVLRSDRDRFGIGGNNPPPDAALEQAVSQIHEGARAVEAQVGAPTPDKAALERAIALLGQGLAALLKWIGHKGDLTVDQLIKWGVPAGCTYLVLNPQKVQVLLDAAKAWLPLI